ncbi:MAG: hypothetical protein IJY83_00760 [Oscillospiraceae bacterium]|nr:hypothetical protein [Oscillospiraceae bacterium]
MKIIREKIAVLTLGSLALLSLVTMTISVMNGDEKKETEVINAETIVSEEKYYILKEYNGKIASFYYDDEDPIDVFDVSVNSFGEYDKQALYKGIVAYSEEELNRLIEDYTS